MKPDKCCGKEPVFWQAESCNDCIGFCRCFDVEKIECLECGRIVYGSGDENIADWNNGGNDE